MNAKISVTVGSIIGACALHFALGACHGNGNAEAAPSDCATWTIAYYTYDLAAPADDIAMLPANQILGQQNMPAGWEPISAAFVGESSNTALRLIIPIRQCAM
jgi:hypothetical protein